MVEASKTSPMTIVGGKDSTAFPREKFDSRRSAELVIGFSGPIGSGIGAVIDKTEDALRAAGYTVVRIKVSSFIEEAVSRRLINDVPPSAQSDEASRYNRLQTLGNNLRNKFNEGGLLAEYVVKKIAEARTETIPDETPLDDHVPERTAYLIDQLKHPGEVALLRAVYRNLFYLVGVLSVSDRREKRLTENGLTPPEAIEVMERDRKEPDEFGQQLDKTLELADFFVRNDKPNVDQLGAPVERFVGLMHGENGITYTKHEYGMYVAYAAALGSACLSRQVGAAILDSDGDVLATGTNDVPKFGGGIYSHESGAADARCVKLEGQKCFNDFHKTQLTGEIRDILKEPLNEKGFSDGEIKALANRVSNESRIKALIEFSRSIHAEMDALLSLARQGGSGLGGARLYSTTFPCHSCARHIVAAGIREVYYIEPYEKSLAKDLHSDSITLEESVAGSNGGATDKVRFIHFEGVSPRQFLNMFRPQGERKKDGRAVVGTVSNASKVVPEYLDSYRDFETKVVEHLQEIVESSDQKTLL